MPEGKDGAIHIDKQGPPVDHFDTKEGAGDEAPAACE